MKNKTNSSMPCYHQHEMTWELGIYIRFYSRGPACVTMMSSMLYRGAVAPVQVVPSDCTLHSELICTRAVLIYFSCLYKKSTFCSVNKPMQFYSWEHDNVAVNWVHTLPVLRAGLILTKLSLHKIIYSLIGRMPATSNDQYDCKTRPQWLIEMMTR